MSDLIKRLRNGIVGRPSDISDRLTLDLAATVALLAEAADALDARSVVRVRGLVWRTCNGGNQSVAKLPVFGSVRAESWGGTFQVVWSVPGICGTLTPGEWDTLESAQAAAQADYEARIMAAVEVGG